MKTIDFRQTLPLAAIAAAWLGGLTLIAPFVQGATTTIATTDDQAPGTPAGALFSAFTAPVLNDGGQVAYRGGLRTGSGGVVSTNNTGVWRDSSLIAREGSQAPGTPAGAVFDFFNSSVLNDGGQVAYRGALRTGSGGVVSTNNTGVWRDSSLIARAGSQAPGTPAGAVFHFFNPPVLNDGGQVAYHAFLRTGAGGVDLTNDRGIWRDSSLIARAGSQAPGTPAGAVFNSFFDPVLNDAGQVAYRGGLRIGSGGVISTNDEGLWRDSLLIARAGSQAPGTPAGALFSAFTAPVLNDAGQVAYRGTLRTGAGGVVSTNNTGVWRDSTLIAREGSQAPGTPAGAVFDFFNPPVLNDGGQVAYRGTLRTGAGGVDLTNDRGIWRDSSLIARAGSQAPGTPAGAVFDFFNPPVLNDGGQVAYHAFLRTGFAGVDSTNDNGLWIHGPNGDALLVARAGDPLAGRTISSLNLFPDSGGSDGRGRSLNNFSQLAYHADFTNGDEGVFLFTPEIHWTRPFTSNWDSTFNWTLGQLPGDPHDVFIDPTVSLTVFGPTGNATMTHLTVGGNNGVATLSLNGGAITSPNAIQITPTGILTGDGVVDADVTNLGKVVADNVTVNGKLTNYNIITGDGFINGAVINAKGGMVEVIGNDLGFGDGLTNTTGGLIATRNAILRFNGGGGLINQGQLAMSFGTSDVFGDIQNESGGQMIVSGNSNATFWNDVTDNGGTIQVSAGSSAVFFGTLTGGTTGSGTVFLEGDMDPGTSPGVADFDGDVAFGPQARYRAELASANGVAGNDHDQINITTNVALDGTLDITLLNSFTPNYSDTFDILTYGTRSGVFQQVTGHFISPVLALGQFYDDANGVLQLLATAPGDANGDLIVNISDFGLLAGNFNQPGTWETGDFDGNGITNINDFGLLAANFNGDFNDLAAAAESFGITFPEPGTVMLIICSLMGMGGSQRRSIHRPQQTNHKATQPSHG